MLCHFLSDIGQCEKIFEALERIAAKFEKPVYVSVHPRTREKLTEFKISPDDKQVKLLEPLGFFDFVHLEKNALAVLSDSGTVQEECCIFRIPNVTLRDVTERPETIECGSNILSGADPENIVRSVELALSHPAEWTPPREYLAEGVAQTVSKVVLGYTSQRKHVS